ncbi:MAG: carbohydrate kinase [Planctomycetaceae bacterium]|nr:carbohydrate kinase [Planctomycetaceae bacterium]
MMRVAPEHKLRLRQVLPGRVEITWGGGEANVCASLAMFGNQTRYVSALPNNALAESLQTSLRGLGVDTSRILSRDGRLGVYYVECGANQRGSTVLYDRSYSSVSLAESSEYDFDSILEGVHWLHISGITPAISKQAFESNLELAKRAKAAGVEISCDLNFRKKLWKWHPDIQGQELARQCMAEVLPYVDLVIGNEEDAADVLDIHAADTDVTTGHLNAAAYKDVAQQIVTKYANVKRVAITLRESISADHNNWGAMLYQAGGDAVFSPLNLEGQYESFKIGHIVDRVGGGDSFAAGLLHALNDSSYCSNQAILDFAVAASCLKHSIKGDFNYVTVAEVEALAGGNTSGRVQR